MHRKLPIPSLLYNYLYPRPTSSDPPNFSNHLARNLIPEIRIETARYYGSLDTIEARYPGLNYTYAPHIQRLSAFPHHARLFHAIRYLRITDSEVLDLARWEGTLWARERFEKDENYKVGDTTGDDIPEWRDPRKVVKVSAIRATTTTTLTTVTGVRQLPLPQTATSCELEVQEPDQPSPLGEIEPVLVATPAQIEADASVTVTAISDDETRSTAESSTSPTFAIISPELHNFFLQRAQDQSLSPAVIQRLEELFNRLAAMRGGSIQEFRDEIVNRLNSANPAELPSVLNLVSAMQLYMDQSHRDAEMESNAATAHAGQVISQPAA